MIAKILFAEDDVNIGMITKQFLEDLDYEVYLYKNGNEVVPAFHRLKPDLCLLDVMLPYKDGFTIGKEIRQDDAKVPIIFITAKSQLKDVLEGFESGANDYIKKPFSLEELKARLFSLLRFRIDGLADEEEPNEFEIGSFLFKHDQQLLIQEGKERLLSPREADLLKELCLHVQNTMDKAKTLRKIWGDDTFYNGRSMDVYITKIRKYLKADASIEILNLRGVGYKLLVKN
ncbi:MAG: response regulator transcription factor [Roseivirga sp.]